MFPELKTRIRYNCKQVTGAIKGNDETTNWQPPPYRKPWVRVELRLLSVRTLMLGQDCNHEWATLGEMRLISERAVTSRNQERPWSTMRLSRGCDRLTNRRRWNRPMVTRRGGRQCCRFFILSCYCLCRTDYQPACIRVLMDIWRHPADSRG